MQQNVCGQSFNSTYDLIAQDQEKMAKPGFKFPIVTPSHSKFIQNHHHLPSRFSASILQEVPSTTISNHQLHHSLSQPTSKPTHRLSSLSQFRRLTFQPLNRPSRSIRSHLRNLSLSTPIITPPDHLTTSTTLAQPSLAATPLRFHHRHHHHHQTDTTSVRCVTEIDTAPSSQINSLPSPQPDQTNHRRLRPSRICSLSTISNLESPSCNTSMNSERPYPQTRHHHHHHHHHSISEVPIQNDPYENSSESSDSHKDLVSRQLWEELEQELGEKIEFPLDVLSSQSSSLSQPFHPITTPRVPSFKVKSHPTLSNLSNKLQPSSSTHNLNLSPALQTNTPRGIASELRESMTTPKPRRPSVPAPRELIKQISGGVPSMQPDPLNTQVDSARTALHKLPLHLQTNGPRRESNASSDISLSAIFGDDTDSVEDFHDLKGDRNSKDVRLSATVSTSSQLTSSQLSINPSNQSTSLTRPRYLSGESTDSEVEVATPNETMMHSLASSVKTSSLDPLNSSLDALQIHQTDETNEARELLDDSWAASSLPRIKPLIPLGTQHTRRPAKASHSSVFVSGEIPITFTSNSNLSSQPSYKSRPSRRGSQPIRHAPHPSTSSIGSIADSQRACSYTSTATNATSNIEAYHQSFEAETLSRSKEASENRVLKAQSAPPGIHGKLQHTRVSSVISQVSVPSPTRAIPEKIITTRRKRSASASVPRQKHSPPTSSLPEIPKDHPALQARPSLDFKSRVPLTDFPKPPIRPCPPPPLPSLPLPPPPSMKLVPITRTLRRQRSQPTLDFSSLSRPPPIVPSPLNLSNTPSPPPSPDRFKFAGLSSQSTSNSHHKKMIDRLIFKEIFSNSTFKEKVNHSSSNSGHHGGSGGSSSIGMNRLRSLSTSRSKLPLKHSRNKSDVHHLLMGEEFKSSGHQNVVKSTFED
ncbi:hypothetical protein DFH28DRAFT_903671 [Melampsora americana]|nr:hypothetical protein DFH28DRAFT_903671 [Melampsora americana]